MCPTMFNHVQQDLHPEVAREEIVEYDEGVKAVNVKECESKEGLEVILIDQEIRSQGILIIEEPVVYCWFLVQVNISGHV